MFRSTFHITKMDCSAEEQMIRMKLEPMENVRHLDFDLEGRKLDVYHEGDAGPVQEAIHSLDLNDRLVETREVKDLPLSSDDHRQRKILWWVLGINFSFFIVEMTFGWISDSMGLIADSLDMLADSIVYGLSLFAVGAALSRKKKIAGISGYFQLSLALLGFAEVVRRFLGFGDMPVFENMIIISALALGGNAVSLWLIHRAKTDEAHMKASWIFTSNDIIVNLGVMIAGGLVYLTASRIPDLVVGSIVFLVVMRGAFRILKLSR